MQHIENIELLDAELQSKQPKEILQRVFELVPDLAISFSGAEDVALIELATKINPDVCVFTLDTGRLHPQTYRFLEKVRNHYEIDIEVMQADTLALQNFVQRKGLYSFYQDGHEECCAIRKIEPLQRKLAQLNGWITGQRRDQSPGRANVAVIENDSKFRGLHGPLVKVNPLANWSSEDVWNYIRLFEVPYNELHDQGFVSIGCEPCSKAIGPNQHEREGRWWWEEATIKECGLHRGNTED